MLLGAVFLRTSRALVLRVDSAYIEKHRERERE